MKLQKEQIKREYMRDNGDFYFSLFWMSEKEKYL